MPPFDDVFMNEWNMAEPSVKKSTAMVDQDRHQNIRTESVHPWFNIINDPMCYWDIVTARTIDRRYKERGLSSWHLLHWLPLTCAHQHAHFSGARFVWLGILLTKVELLSEMNPASNSVPMTNEDEYANVQKCSGLLSWLSPVKEPGNQELWSGMPFHLIAGPLWLSYVASL